MEEGRHVPELAVESLIDPIKPLIKALNKFLIHAASVAV